MNKIVYSVIVSLGLLAPGSVLISGQNAELNATNTNATTTDIEEPARGSQSDWIPVHGDWWDDQGLHGKTIYYNQKTGETREPLPYSESGLPLCHDPLYREGLLGDMCHDELNHDTCEEGFIDRGFGCEPENGDGTVPPTCPPSCPNDEDLPTPPPIDDDEAFDRVNPVEPDDTGKGDDNDNDDNNDNGNENPDPNPPEDDFFKGGNNGSFFE